MNTTWKRETLAALTLALTAEDAVHGQVISAARTAREEHPLEPR